MKTIRIGRKPDNDIVITDETQTVSGYHAVLKVSDNGSITLCDSSTNGTYINGIKVSKDVDVSVKKGDEVRLGPHVLLDWSKIIIPSQQQDATEIDIADKETYSIGTASDNQIVISDSTNHVSRHHAVLKLRHDGKYYIYDQSTNGTYVNGVKIKSKVDFPVSVTDTISLSNTFQFDWNKVPNVSLPKLPPYIPPVQPPIPQSRYSTNKTSGNKIWSYLFFGTIFIGTVYFSYHKTQSNTRSHALEKAPLVDSTIVAANSNIKPAQTNNSTIPIVVGDISTLYEQHKDAVFVVYTSDGKSSSQGSGFFISSSGVAVSNYHVFKGSQKGLESIKTENGTFKVESVLASSDENDYIVFKVAGNGTTFRCLNIASSLPRVGEDVFAIGAPEGLEQTLSKGIVSAIRSDSGLTLIQTTTQITHGSSGGPLFNMHGEVIGITSAGMGQADLNFAVSIVGKGFENY
jgi:serine protease Do